MCTYAGGTRDENGARGTAADYERDVLRSGRRTTEFVSWTTRPVTPGSEFHDDL